MLSVLLVACELASFELKQTCPPLHVETLMVKCVALIRSELR